MTAEPNEITHNAARRRFEAAFGDSLAVLDYSPVDATTLDYRHTFVPPAVRGRGIASRLVRFGLDYALEQRLTVIPTCPFVAAYIRGHPRYRALLENR
ncbi:MAG TPA: GNAT family N-acetyltransferase [Gammaproteobacteria bacterium]|nr:GNAT family N-acetyltransferase [Gammaproteobacteria bacterium]